MILLPPATAFISTADQKAETKEVFWDNPDATTDLIQDRLGRPSSSWNVVVIDGTATPGLAFVSGKKGGRVDRKQTPGKDGVVITHLGYEPAQIEISLHLWTALHWTAWQYLLPKLQPPAKRAKPDRHTVYHPVLAAYGISNLFVVSISLPKDVHPRGVKEVQLTCQEWAPGKGDNTNTAGKAGNAEYVSDTFVKKNKALSGPDSSTPPSQTRAGAG